MSKFIFIATLALFGCDNRGDGTTNIKSDDEWEYADWPYSEYSEYYKDQINEIDRLLEFNLKESRSISLEETFDDKDGGFDEVHRLIQHSLAIEEEAFEDMQLRQIQKRREEMKRHYPGDTRRMFVEQ